MDRTTLADRTLNTHFRTTQFQVGYSEVDVDDFIDHVISLVRNGEPGSAIAHVVRSKRLRTTKWQRGYHRTDVDAFLKMLVTELGELPD